MGGRGSRDISIEKSRSEVFDLAAPLGVPLGPPYLFV